MVVIALRMGAYPISVRDIVMTLFNGTLGRRGQVPAEFRLVVFGLRLPRIALGILVGASLSTAARDFRRCCEIRWPILTFSEFPAGRRSARSSSLIVAPHAPVLIQVAASRRGGDDRGRLFLGRRGGQLDSTTLLLAGIMTASFLSAVIMFLMTTLSGRDLRGMAFWLMGDLSTPPPIGSRWLYLGADCGGRERSIPRLRI